jgi:DNA (cytosine-5)-methyltransferase 1
MYKAISLFSGAGGDTLGMINAGINVVGYVEMDKDAISTHEFNFTECKCIGTDITKIDSIEFEKYRGEIDIIFGGFPCQSFSQGGKKNAKDKRGFLYQEFVRCANVIKPKIIIGENVKGLLNRETEQGKLMINKIIQDFESIGYVMNISLFNMKNYGIPQDRERIIIYGVRKDIDVTINLNNIPISDEKKCINDILEYNLYDSIKIQKKNIINLFPTDVLKVNYDIHIEGKPPTNLVKCYNNNELSFKKRSKSTYSCIVDKNDVSRTILSTYGRMPRLFVPVVKGEKENLEYYLRPYTVRELARIQGFPDEFIFKGKYLQQVVQIGNAIPPIFVKKIFDYILQILNGDVIEIF